MMLNMNIRKRTNAIIACRIVEEKAKELYYHPTIAVLDQFIQRAKDLIKVLTSLLASKELDSASKRLLFVKKRCIHKDGPISAIKSFLQKKKEKDNIKRSITTIVAFTLTMCKVIPDIIDEGKRTPVSNCVKSFASALRAAYDIRKRMIALEQQ